MYVPMYSQVCRVLGMYQGYVLISNLAIYSIHVLAKVDLAACISVIDHVDVRQGLDRVSQFYLCTSLQQSMLLAVA